MSNALPPYPLMITKSPRPPKNELSQTNPASEAQSVKSNMILDSGLELRQSQTIFEDHTVHPAYFRRYSCSQNTILMIPSGYAIMQQQALNPKPETLSPKEATGEDSAWVRCQASGALAGLRSGARV